MSDAVPPAAGWARAAGMATAWVPRVAAAVAAAPLLAHGLPEGHDWAFELARVAEWRHAVAEGQAPPFWAPGLYGGYGSPIFLFYAPLFCALASLGSVVFGSVAQGMVAALCTLPFVAAASMRALVLAVVGDAPASRAAAALAAALYALHPYLLGNLYDRNANAELTALALAPLALAGVARARTDPGRGALQLGAGVGLVVLAHNLSALFVAGMIVALALGTVRTRRHGLAVVGGGALGLGLSAFLWIPALLLGDLMRRDELVRGAFDFHAHFKPVLEWIATEPFFSMGPLAGLLVVALPVALSSRWDALTPDERRWAVSLALLLLALLFLQTAASTTMWELVPLLPLAQFPWRLMGPTALVTALLAAVALARWRPPPSAPALLGTMAGALALLVAAAAPRLLGAAGVPATRLDPAQTLVAPDVIAASGVTATVRDEYLPPGPARGAWREKRGREGALLESNPPVALRVREPQGTRLVLEKEAGPATAVTLARWAFPGWQARAGAQRLEVGRALGGTLLVQLPEGAVTAEVFLQAPRERTWALALSALSLAAGVALALGLHRRAAPATH